MSSKHRGWAFERARESERLHWNSTWPIMAFEKTQRPPSLCTGTARRTLGTLALALPEGFLHWHCQSASHSAGTARGPLAMALRECLSLDTLSLHSHFCIERGPLQRFQELSQLQSVLLVSMYVRVQYKYSQSHLGWHSRNLKAQSSNVSFATFQWKETFELWALRFETPSENVTPSGIGCTSTRAHACACACACVCAYACVRTRVRVCLRLCGILPASFIKGLLLRSGRCVCVEQTAYFFLFFQQVASRQPR